MMLHCGRLYEGHTKNGATVPFPTRENRIDDVKEPGEAFAQGPTLQA